MGKIPFDLTQLVHIREALSRSTCTITHLLMEQVSQEHPRPIRSSTARGAQLEVDGETGNPWKNMLRALIRTNRKKHTMFLLSVDELRNGIIKRACSTWFNPLNHGRNKAWLEEEKLSRASRARAELLPGEHPKAGTGVAVRMKSRGFGWGDGEITDVHPDDRVTVLWESGAATTTG